MNVEDSEQIELQLESLGMSAADDLYNADVVLLNTCSVRKKPEDKAFSTLGELRKLRKIRPHMVIGVCGCMAQLRAEEIHKRCPHVDFIIGTAQIASIPNLVIDAQKNKRFQLRLDLPERKGAVVTDVPDRLLSRNQTTKIKAFVPIQYGCDKFCTFCIVPSTRGRERSRSTESIIREIEHLSSQGVKEITLLGQTVNSYGKNLLEGKVPFSRLLTLIADIPGIERIRYTSPYPRDYTQGLLDVHRNCKKVMPHVHLPVQSGNNEILKAMRRLYTVESFEEIYWKLRDIPGMAVTTDVIVGFPGETEKQFHDTLRLFERLRFDSAFMFAYSPRPGTPASTMEQVKESVKRRRLNELIALQNKITCDRNLSEVGEVFDVLVEGPSEKNPTLSKGLTPHGKTVHFPTHPSLAPGTIVPVQTESAHLWGFHAKQHLIKQVI